MEENAESTSETINELAEEPSAIVLQGLQYDPEDLTSMHYYIDGLVDASYTGFAQLADGSD